MLIYKTNLHKKIGPLSKLEAEKITFPPKPDGWTDRQTYGRKDGHRDILDYRVASLIKKSQF